MEVAANRDVAGKDGPELGQNLAKAKLDEDANLTFQLQTPQATSECRALT